MLKKELRDTLRILLESSVPLLAIPVVFGLVRFMGFVVSFSEMAYGGFLSAVILFAGYSGLGMFYRERKDKGFEYLLSLPYSKLRIFIYKVVPRVVVLVMIGVLPVIFTNLEVSDFLLPLLFLQLGMLFLSLAFGSLFAGIIAGVILAYFYVLSGFFVEYFFRYFLGLEPIVPSNILAALCLLVPLGISFFLAYKNLDLKPYKYTVRPYLYVAVPLLMLQVIIIFLNFERLAEYF